MANKRLLKAIGADLSTVAQVLQAKGRGKDKILAHITPGEAVMLKVHGGRGSRHPETGLLEFDDTPIETVISTAPTIAPAITAPTPTIGKSVPAPVSNSAPETVTVTGTKAPAPAISAPLPDPVPLTATPLPATPPTATVQPPPAVAAPETVTVTGQQPGPAIQPPAPLPSSGGVTIPAASAPQDDSLGGKAKGFLSNNSTLLELGGLAALGFLGGKNSTKAAKGATELQGNLANLAAPISTAGNAELTNTLAGGLTPGRLRAIEAIQAQLGQSQAMGAVSSQQVAQSISETFATQLQAQLQEALNLLTTADSYLQTAYVDGYNANNANQVNTTNFYTNLATLAARFAGLDTAAPTTAGGG